MEDLDANTPNIFETLSEAERLLYKEARALNSEYSARVKTFTNQDKDPKALNGHLSTVIIHAQNKFSNLAKFNPETASSHQQNILLSILAYGLLYKEILEAMDTKSDNLKDLNREVIERFANSLLDQNPLNRINNPQQEHPILQHPLLNKIFPKQKTESIRPLQKAA